MDLTVSTKILSSSLTITIQLYLYCSLLRSSISGSEIGPSRPGPTFFLEQLRYLEPKTLECVEILKRKACQSPSPLICFETRSFVSLHAMHSEDDVPANAALPRMLSLRRYVSDDMSSVGLDSPRNTKNNSWPDGIDDDLDPKGRGSGCCHVLGPFTNPIIGGETLHQLTTSWGVASEVLLAWRFVMFLYMVGTSFYLARRGSLVAFTLSAEIYLLSLLASAMLLFPHFVGQGSGGCPGGASFPRSNSSFGRTSRPYSSDGGKPCFANLRQLLFTTTTLVVQSACSLTVFWDTIYWYQLRFASINTPRVDALLLHSYNFMPVLTELAFGRIEFRLIYFVPGILFLTTFFGLIAFDHVDVNAADWVASVFNQRTKRSAWVGMILSYTCSCGLVFAVQRARSSIDHRLGICRVQTGVCRRGRSRSEHRGDFLESNRAKPGQTLSKGSQ